jgi:transposase
VKPRPNFYGGGLGHGGVKIAPVPARILPRSNAALGLLAHVIIAEYVDGLPLYRPGTIFARPTMSAQGGIVQCRPQLWQRR